MGWVLLSIAIGLFVFFTLLVETERWGWATAALLVTGGVYSYFNRTEAIGWMSHHWQDALLFITVYLVAGIAWSFIKWFSFLMGFRDRLSEVKVQYQDYVTARLNQRSTMLNMIVDSSEPLVQSFQDWTASRQWGGLSYLGNSLTERPRAAHNKSRIVAWMSFWPFSMVGTVLNDPIRRMFNWAYNLLSSLYQRMSDYVFRNEEFGK